MESRSTQGDGEVRRTAQVGCGRDDALREGGGSCKPPAQRQEVGTPGLVWEAAEGEDANNVGQRDDGEGSCKGAGSQTPANASKQAGRHMAGLDSQDEAGRLGRRSASDVKEIAVTEYVCDGRDGPGVGVRQNL